MAGPTRFRVRETFTTRVLGSAPANPEVYENYILSKRIKEEERRKKAAERKGVETVPPKGSEAEELETIRDDAGVTVFHNDLDGITESGEKGKGLFFYDYQIAGFWKEAAEILAPEHGIKQPRSKLDNFMIIDPRRVYIHGANGDILTKPSSQLERPLRAMTMQGPRVSLACSEVIDPGCWIEYELDFLPYLKRGSGKEAKAVDIHALVEALGAFGRRKGRGQWRNGGNGRFDITIKPV